MLVAGAVLSLLLVAAGALGLTGVFSSNPTSTGNGQRNALDGTRLHGFAPPLTLVAARGDLAAPWTRGHAAVLLFFARWCAPCAHEVPALARALGRGVIGGVDVIGVDEDTAAVARAFVRSTDVRFPVGVDHFEELAARLVPAGLPAAVFVRADGVVADVKYGALTVMQLSAGLSELRGGAAHLPSPR